MHTYDKPLWVAIAALATWRISSILTNEEIAQPLREKLGIIDSEGYIDAPDTFIAQVFSCLWCMSVWVGLVALLALILLPQALIPFALSAIAVMIEKKLNG